MSLMQTKKELMLKYIQENSGSDTIADLEDRFYEDVEKDDNQVWLIWFDKEKNQIAWKSDRKIFVEDFLDLCNSRQILVQSTNAIVILMTSRMLNLPITKNHNVCYKKEHWTSCLVLDGNQHREFIKARGMTKT